MSHLTPTHAWVALLLVSLFGGGCRSTTESSLDAAEAPDQEDLVALVDVLLDASAEYAAKIQEFLDSTSKLHKGQVDMNEEQVWEFVFTIASSLHEVGYPSRHADARGARNVLLSRRREAFPVALKALQSEDLTDHLGFHRATFAHRLLTEVAGGSFAWKELFEQGAEEHNERVVDAWSEYWTRTKDVDEIWSRACTDAPGPTVEIEDLKWGWASTVVPRGGRLRALTSEGPVEIRADGGFGRFCTWDGETTFSWFEPERESWRGRLGLRGIWWWGLEREAQIPLANVDGAASWLRRLDPDVVYRSDGLVFSWKRCAQSGRIDRFSVWQIYIDGAKPESLPGSTDDALICNW